MAVRYAIGRGPTAPADPSANRVVLTPKGAAVVALLRFERLLRDLDPADRAYFADELAMLAGEVSVAR